MKKNKKGFTLVELLAVIAVLAILILLVIPNVMKLFNDAKQKSFETELKEIYKTAQQKWMMESLNKKEERVYARVKGLECANELSLTGRTELDYVIKLDKKGKVVLYFATDNTYEYTYRGPGLDISSIDGVIQISKKDTNRQIQMTCTTAQLITPPPENEGEFLMTPNGTSHYQYENNNFLRTGIKKDTIEKITIKDSKEGHTVNGIDCWDISQGYTESVIAWATDTDNNGLYELTIGADGPVFLKSGHYLFSYLPSLTSITGLENLDTSQATTMARMFQESKLLTTINLENFDTRNVTSMEQMFYECSGLTALDVSSFNTSNVTSFSAMFKGCSSLTSIDVSNFDTSNALSIDWMFSHCSNLINIDLSNFDTSKVTKMNCLFQQCTNLKSVNIKSFDTSNVTTMINMFYGCENLTTLDLSNFNTKSVTSMERMFYSNKKMEAIYTTNDFNTSSVTISDDMFYNCTNLVGGSGTTYKSSNPKDKTYARIDGGTSSPGYFTLKTN